MSLRRLCPCDTEGHCPYEVDVYGGSCEWYCSAEEPEDRPEIWEEEEDEKMDL